MSEYSSSNHSDSWSSSYTDFSPFSSSFSTYDIFQQKKPNESSSETYSSFSKDQQYKGFNFQNLNERIPVDNSALHTVYEERNKKNRQDDGYFYDRDNQNEQKQKTQQKNLQQLPYKKLQDFTIKEVLQLPLARQQYLKSLSNDQLSQQAEFKYIFSKPDSVFDIGNHYKKEIGDEYLRTQITKMNNRKEAIDAFLMISLLGYVFGANYLEKYSPFKGQMRTKYHIIFPITFIFGSIVMEQKITNKRQHLLEDEKVKAQFKTLVRKYLCQTSEKERRQIMKKELNEENKNKK